MGKSPSIAELATSVFDNGRRGTPKLGCDCVQCFGYCMVDRDEALRSSFDRGAVRNSGRGPLDLGK